MNYQNERSRFGVLVSFLIAILGAAHRNQFNGGSVRKRQGLKFMRPPNSHSVSSLSKY